MPLYLSVSARGGTGIDILIDDVLLSGYLELHTPKIKNRRTR